MSEQVPSKEQFRDAAPLHGRVIDAHVPELRNRPLIEIEDHGNRIGIADARALRDWLNKVLPESAPEPPAEPTAYLDEKGRVVTVGANRYGGFVGDYRAVPNSWTPLYRAAQPPLLARPLNEWHEDMGDVVWWKFPVDEPAWIGSPLASDWPGYHTHWTPHPAVPEAIRYSTATKGEG